MYGGVASCYITFIPPIKTKRKDKMGDMDVYIPKHGTAIHHLFRKPRTFTLLKQN